MGKAFVLINCEPGKEPFLLKQLRDMKNVIDVQGTHGAYDIVARIESDSKSQLGNIISDQILKLENVTSTLTLIPTESENELAKLVPDLIPDVIPEEKKPPEEKSSEDEDEFGDEPFEED